MQNLFIVENEFQFQILLIIKFMKFKRIFFIFAGFIFYNNRFSSNCTFIVDRSRGILPSQGRLIQTGVKIIF